MIGVTPSLLVQLIDDFLNISFYFVCIVLPASFAWAACACSAPQGPEEGAGTPGSGIRDACEVACGC